MKKTTKKLVLSKETLRALNDADLRQVAGGMRDTENNCQGRATEVTDCNCYYPTGVCMTSGYHGCCP
jgi:hypothetical protein